MHRLLIVAAASAALLLVTSVTAQDAKAKPAAAKDAQHAKPPQDAGEKDREKPTVLQLGQAVDATIELPDIDGKLHSMKDLAGNITVVNFWATRCPIQKGWDPTLARIQRDYADRGVTFLMINSNEANGELTDPDLEADQKPYQEIRKVLQERDLPYTVLVDHQSVVADRFGAKTTPDIFVFDRQAQLVYRGLIDDDLRGDKGDEATHHLRNTLDALLAGKDVKPTETRPHGCSIKRAKKAKDGAKLKGDAKSKPDGK